MDDREGKPLANQRGQERGVGERGTVECSSLYDQHMSQRYILFHFVII